MKIAGNTILITGGTSGIGLELARQLLPLGNTIIITGRNQEKLDATMVALPGIFGIRSDVSDPDAIARLYADVTAKFPGLNMLINNAGIMREINFHAPPGDLRDLTREIDTNLNGPIRMATQLLPHLKKQQQAAIINISSGLAFLPMPGSAVYCAAKAAIHSFSISLRIQLKRTNVKVFELAPPLTLTPLVDAFDPQDMKGIPVMAVEKLARLAIRGISRDQLEIRPGMSNLMKFISRLAPNRLLRVMLGTSVDRMLDATPPGR
jgi:uncharacterized oxidoreductase